MKRLLVIALVLAAPGSALAQGVRDPSSPNGAVVIVNPPSQPSRPTATPNIPTGIQPPVTIRRGATAYGSGARGSGSRR